MWFTTLSLFSLLSLAISTYGYTVDSDTLQELLAELQRKQVRESRQQDPFQKTCGGLPTEIVFIIDDSRSIYELDFNDQIKFLANFVKIFTIGRNAVRVGVVTYGQVVIDSNTFPLTKYENEADLVNGISNIKFEPDLGGSTQTGLAIKYAREKIFRYAREGVKKLAFVITDGSSSNRYETKMQAFAARREGIQIVAIGVGRRANYSELLTIAGKPDYVFMITGYQALDTIKKTMELKACAPPTTTPAPTTPQMEEPCEKDIDINFVFDSAMLGEQSTQDVVKFIKSSISNQDLRKNNIRFGAVAPPCNKVYGFKLNQYKTKNEIMKHFDKFHQTSLGPLLSETAGTAFNIENGGRPAARRVAVIFLKGKLDDPTAVMDKARALRAKGIEVFLIKMDNMNSWSVLENLAPSSHILDASSTSNMIYLSGELSNRLCKRRT